MAFNTKPFGAAYYDMKLDGAALVNVPTTGADVGIGIGSGVSAETALQISGTFPTSGTNTLLIKTDGNVPSGTTTTARMFSTGVGTTAASFTLGGLQHFTAVQGSFGAGSTVTSQYGFLADSSLTGATNNYAFFADLTEASGRWNFYAGGTADNYMAGRLGVGNTPFAAAKIHAAGTYPSSSNTTLTFLADGAVPSGTTSNARMFASSPSTAAASFTLTNLAHFHASQQAFGAGSTVTNQYGFVANSTLTGATNNYGFLSSIAAGTGRYNFYAGGDADNYFAGSVGIGAVTTAGEKFKISGTLPSSGGVTFGAIVSGTVPSTTTTTAAIFVSSATTQAASFTLDGLQHFRVSQGTFGAGSAVNNQYGFLVQSGMTGATNNYAFFADLASGSGRFNFYAGGDAVNYFAGNVGINTTTPSEKLEVNGSIKTAAPAGGTAASWRLGTVATVSPTSPNRTIEVEIGGTIYYLHAKTTND